MAVRLTQKVPPSLVLSFLSNFLHTFLTFLLALLSYSAQAQICQNFQSQLGSIGGKPASAGEFKPASIFIAKKTLHCREQCPND